MAGLDIFAIVVLLVLVAAIIVGWIVLAMLPGKIARSRHHPQAEAINVGGWISALLIGPWPIMLIWAYTRPFSDAGLNEENQRLRQELADLESNKEPANEGAS